MTIAAAIAIGFWLGINFGVLLWAPLPTGASITATIDRQLGGKAMFQLDKAREIFAAAIKHWPRIRLTIRQQTRVLEQWPAI